MNKDLSDKEIEDFSNLTNKVLAEICRISDAHNIDRDSALKYFADMLTAFIEVATIQNYDSKQTNADRIRSMTDEELLDFICSIETYDDGSVKTIEGGVAMCSVTEVEQWLKAESEESEINIPGKRRRQLCRSYREMSLLWRHIGRGYRIL